MDEQVITSELQKFQTTDAAIAKLRQDYMALKISGLEDKEGYEKVHLARMDVKTRRVSVTKRGKELREDAVKFQKSVIAEEKRIIYLLSPIEDHLGDEESRVDEEKARIKAEADFQEAARIQARVNILFSLGCRFDGMSYSYGNLIAPQALVKTCSDEQFETFCSVIREAIEKEAEQKAEDERLRKEEAERLAKIAKEQEAERQRLAKEAKALQDEKDRLEREKKAAEDAKIREEQTKVRAAEMEKAKAEAAEKAMKETEERLKRETEARIAKEEAARVRAAKKDARRPDKERLIAYIDSISVPQITMKTEDGNTALMDILTILEKAIAEMRLRVEQL